MSALDENIRKPATAATAKATQVQGSISRASSLKGRSRLASPKRRKSTVMIEPTTNTSANTCTVSMVGNSQTDSRIWVGKFRSCSHVRACSTAMRYSLHIGNPTSGRDNAGADNHGDQADGAGRVAPRRRFGPILRVLTHAQLHNPKHSGERQYHEHFYPKCPIEQL